jgi:uncharacterized membrane protein
MASASPPRQHERQDTLLALVFTVAGLASRLPFIGADEGWFDEHYSIITSTQSAIDIVKNAMLEQTNPPGYYLLAHVWGLLGDASIGWHRIIPAVCGALVPAVMYLAARRFGYSRAAAIVVAALLLVAPVPWNMSLEVRGYATLALLTALGLYVAAGVLESNAPASRRQLATLAAIHVAQVLLHYFAAFAVLGVSLALADQERRRVDSSAREQWIAALRRAFTLGAPAALTIALWIAASFTLFRGAGGQNVEWIPESSAWQAFVGLSSVFLANMTAVAGLWLSRATLLFAVAVAAWLAWDTRSIQVSPHRARTLLVLVAVPIGGALVAHAVSGGKLWVPRYATVFTPALALLMGLLVESIATRWRSLCAFAIIAWWSVAGANRFANRTPKPDWSRIIAQLAPNGEATICADRSFVGLPFIYQANVSGRKGIIVLNAPLCRPGHGITWFVYDVEPTGVKPAPQVPGLVLGPRIVLFRGMQNLDARRVIARYRVQ